MAHNTIYTISEDNARAVIDQYSIDYYTRKPHGKRSFCIKAIYHAFQWFISPINHLGCWNNTRKACKSSLPAISSRVLLPTSRLVY